MTGHSSSMPSVPVSEPKGDHGVPASRTGGAAGDPREGHPNVEAPSFSEVYAAHVDYVWRAARRLGLSAADADDAVQDVFVIVHRRLAEFEGRSSLKTWLFGIAIRVVRDQRRRRQRKPATPLGDRELPASEAGTPEHHAGVSEGLRLLQALLDTLDDDKRETFVLAELERLTAPEIAAALELNVNTVYARLRAARRAFQGALERHRARTGESQ